MTSVANISMETFEETLPATVYGIEKYLGSGLVKGIGPAFAGRIVRQVQKSRIIMNAHRINEGRMPDIPNGRTSDFFFMDMEKQALKKVLDTRLISEAELSIAYKFQKTVM